MLLPVPKLFVVYARKDRGFVDELSPYLDHLEQQGVIEWFFDEKVPFGADWHSFLRQELSQADFVVLLVSQRFLVSDYIREHEMPVVAAKHFQNYGNILAVAISNATISLHPF